MPVLLVLSTESAPSRKSSTHANGVLLYKSDTTTPCRGFNISEEAASLAQSLDSLGGQPHIEALTLEVFSAQKAAIKIA